MKRLDLGCLKLVYRVLKRGISGGDSLFPAGIRRSRINADLCETMD
jgi:hypothetical protein